MKVQTVEQRRSDKRNMRLQKKLHVGRFERRCFNFKILNCPDVIENEKVYYDVVDCIFDLNDLRDDGVFVGFMCGFDAHVDFAAGTLHDDCWSGFLDEIIECFELSLQKIVPEIKVVLDTDDEMHLADAWYGPFY